MIVLIDNYDSFTYNLYQYICELGYDVKVFRNDKVTVEEIAKLAPSHIVISPGPGRPEDAGVTVGTIKAFAGKIPILGVCLGHQAIGLAFGGKVIRAPEPRHGKVSDVFHDGKTIFRNIKNPFSATRYHSLIVERSSLPEDFEVSAWTQDHLIMGLRHKTFPVEGVQFHPESIMTDAGKDMLKNFFGIGIGEDLYSPQLGVKYHDIMQRLTASTDLSEEESYHTFYSIMNGDWNDIQIAGYLSALKTKGETVGEIAGAVLAMLEKCVKIKADKYCVDTCGTGGDMSGTFNISTAAAFVAAGAGVTIAKHGNRSITSKSGSSDVLTELGVRIDASPAIMKRAINQVGIGFLFAPLYHPAMKYVMPVRRELKVRTVFNILGPLTNPARAEGRVLGVFSDKLLDPLADVLLRIGVKRAFVLHGADGLDEISLCGETTVVEVKDGKTWKYVIKPEDFGMKRAVASDLAGEGPRENAVMILEILKGMKGPKRDVVLINAAAAIVAGNLAKDMTEGIMLAAKSIDSGAALEKLEKLKIISNEKE